MTKEELLEKANYIQFPYFNKEYVDYDKYCSKIVKLPIIPNGNNILYEGLKENGHHYTTSYHIHYVLPCLSKIFNLNFKLDDFNLVKNLHKQDGKIFDLSYLAPKNDFSYTVECLERNIILNNVKFDKLVNNKEKSYLKTPYHLLCIAHHEPCIITNNTLNNNRNLFISGDSQMIPSILPLTNYYKQIFYMDNRTGLAKDKNGKIYLERKKTKSFFKTYENILFDDVLVELYANKLENYTVINLI